MKNPEDHKKLLAQIEELSRNSINYFDVEKEFFLIDSENLSNVRPHFYGYSIQRDGIYEEENLTPEAISNLDGRGCYIYIDVKDNEITIKQDLNGCWGIYLFQNGNYFALSNSFFRLLDHVKYRYPLTVNRDYCNYISVDGLCSSSCIETAVNEIQIIDRSAILHIDRFKKILEIESIDYKEHSISPDSVEGIGILDQWAEFWSGVFRKLTQNTKFIQADLSGGFDSRIALVPLIYSGTDLNQIRINSVHNNLYTHSEDYEIASQIAAHYNFELNRTLPDNQNLNYSLYDGFDVNLHSRQLFSNLSGVPTKKSLNKIYAFTGANGETLRYYWRTPLKEFVATETQRADRYSPTLAIELRRSFENIFASNSRYLRNKYKIDDADSVDITNFMYLETRGRWHFGKAAVSSYFSNILSLFPASDPEICTLSCNSAKCPDYNLMVALLFDRYAPDLLKFPIQGNRSIAPETIDYAKKINERFPIIRKDVNSGGVQSSFSLLPRDSYVEKILASNQNNPEISEKLSQDCLKAVFDTSRVYGLFTAYFDMELYNNAMKFYEKYIFARTRPAYVITGVAKVIEDVEISQNNRLSNGYVQRFLNHDFAKFHEDVSINPNFLPHITARVEIQLVSVNGDFQIVSVSDDTARVTKPNWIQGENRIGFCIHSHSGILEFSAKATTDGKVILWLRGMDKRYPEDNSKRIPYWIDYTKFMVDEDLIFDKITPTWHDQPYRYQKNVKAGEEIKIKVEWLPHLNDA